MSQETRYIGNRVVTKSTIVIVDRNDSTGKVYMRKDITGYNDEQIVKAIQEIERQHGHLLRGRKLLVRHN